MTITVMMKHAAIETVSIFFIEGPPEGSLPCDVMNNCKTLGRKYTRGNETANIIFWGH
jgi:hypothetical protein